MVPAHQRLHTGHPALMAHHRLVVQHQFAYFEPVSQIDFKRGTLLHCRLHVGVKKAQRVAPSGFGLVHRQVGTFEQFIDTVHRATKHRNADAGRAVVRFSH